MATAAVILGGLLVAAVLWEGFETIILPRRVTRPFHGTRIFYQQTWLLWSGASARVFSGRRLDNVLSYYGPLSLLSLLVIWGGLMIVGFGTMQWGLHAAAWSSGGAPCGFSSCLYLSATTFFTLGLGDVMPSSSVGRFLAAVEAGTGFGFLALTFAYLPALNQSFSRREVTISLLDARAGSPPSAGEMLLRHAGDRGLEPLERLLHEWEGWAAEFLESQLSYPVLAYFRSQHDNQSWLAALIAVLDTCALVMTGRDGLCARQAGLTFAMARHALVDLALVFHVRPREPSRDRLPAADLDKLHSVLAEAGLQLTSADGGRALSELRRSYEPYVEPLASYFRMGIPSFLPQPGSLDNWQKSEWNSLKRRPFGKTGHF